MSNVADQNQKKCDSCQKLFQTQQGLDSHQSRDTPQNRECHRVQTLHNREAVQTKVDERKVNVKSIRLQTIMLMFLWVHTQWDHQYKPKRNVAF